MVTVAVSVVSLSFVLSLDRHQRPPRSHRGLLVRELARDEVVAILGGTPLGRSPRDLDAIAPSGWRCFAAFTAGGPVAVPVHVSFVALGPRPLLFAVLTIPAWRRHGAFSATVAAMAGALAEVGHRELRSSVALRNWRSLLAHWSAGFRPSLLERLRRSWR